VDPREGTQGPDAIGVDALLGLAIEQARLSDRLGSVPVGCVIADPDGQVLSLGRNRVGEGEGALAHAEIDAIRRSRFAPNEDSRWTIASSWEPCLMCLGAILIGPFYTLIWACDSRDSALAALATTDYRRERLASLTILAEPSPRHREESRELVSSYRERLPRREW
jgi:tRNA(Arg) A34 adenosine deaminase TadA